MADESSADRAALMDDPRVPEILDIVARETSVDRGNLQPEATIEALGIPSLDMVQAVFALESAVRRGNPGRV